MSKFITRFLKDESGATAIEYALIAAGMAAIVVAMIPIIGPKIEALWNGIATNTDLDPNVGG